MTDETITSAIAEKRDPAKMSKAELVDAFLEAETAIADMSADYEALREGITARDEKIEAQEAVIEGLRSRLVDAETAHKLTTEMDVGALRQEIELLTAQRDGLAAKVAEMQPKAPGDMTGPEVLRVCDNVVNIVQSGPFKAVNVLMQWCKLWAANRHEAANHIARIDARRTGGK